jgi:hypothetical protein
MCAAIALKLCTWLYNYDLQIRFEDACYRLIFGRVMPLEGFTVFRTFFSLLTDIHLIFGTLLCHTKMQINSEFGFDPLIFHEVMALGLRKISQIISFPHIFFLCLQIFISYLVSCFAILSYRSSSSLVLIH